MAYVRARGARFWVEDQGQGVPVVLSHSLFFDCEMFAAQAEALAGRYRVIRYDHRGQGRSDAAPRAALTIPEVAADAARHGGAFGRVELEREHQELRAADAGQYVVLTEGHGQGAGHGQKRGVAGLVAVALVQVLHVADVDEERVHRGLLAVGELQQLGA